MAGFKDIVGQEKIKEHMLNAIRMDKVSHAYIIQGELGAGKEFITKVFAKTIQCERSKENPCEECRSCKQIDNKNHPDVIWVSHEKPNSIGVEDIRTQINNDMGIKPYYGPKKIYIVNECEKKDVADLSKLKMYFSEGYSQGITRGEISASTGISAKNLNRFLGYEEFSGIFIPETDVISSLENIDIKGTEVTTEV